MTIIFLIFIYFYNLLTYINTTRQIISLKKDLPSLLTYKDIYKINAINNPIQYGANYISSGKFIDEQDEYSARIANEIVFQDNHCYFDKDKFMENLDLIRDKHQVQKVKWDADLENKAKTYTSHLREKNCRYEDRVEFSELHYQATERLTEKEVLEKWYDPVYYYNFTNSTFMYEKMNTYSMTVLLWDNVTAVGCAKACCPISELFICDFLPIIIQPDILQRIKHIKPNRFLHPDEKKNSGKK
jgi:hypothetical protein